jgi:hypothetical protein
MGWWWGGGNGICVGIGVARSSITGGAGTGRVATKSLVHCTGELLDFYVDVTAV